MGTPITNIHLAKSWISSHLYLNMKSLNENRVHQMRILQASKKKIMLQKIKKEINPFLINSGIETMAETTSSL